MSGDEHEGARDVARGPHHSHVRAQVEAGTGGRIVAIDIETGAVELGDDVITAATGLLARPPDAQPWIVRIGYPAVYRIGLRGARETA